MATPMVLCLIIVLLMSTSLTPRSNLVDTMVRKEVMLLVEGIGKVETVDTQIYKISVIDLEENVT